MIPTSKHHTSAALNMYNELSGFVNLSIKGLE